MKTTAQLSKNLLILIFLQMITFGAISRDAPITFVSGASACPGAELTLPVTVNSFSSVSSITLRLDYNPQLMVYNAHSNVNTLLSGILIVDNTVTPTLHKIIIVWSNVNPVTLSDGAKLLDLHFTYLSAEATLSFNNTLNGGGDCEYSDENGDPMNDMPTNSFYSDAQITNLAVGPVGNISGPSTVSQGQSGVEYSVTPVINATGYNWSLPDGATISSGINTNSILVDFSASAITGEIIVQPFNACGYGEFSVPFPVTVNSLPGEPIISNSVNGSLEGTFSQTTPPVLEYIVTAANLTDNLTITASTILSFPEGLGHFVVSLSPTESFTDQITITPVNGYIDTTIYVKSGIQFFPIECSGVICQTSNGAIPDTIETYVACWPGLSYAPVVSIGQELAATESTVYVPVNAVNFNNVGEIRYTIDFDPTVLSFSGIANIQEGLPEQLCTNCTNAYECCIDPHHYFLYNVISVDSNQSKLYIEIAVEASSLFIPDGKLFDLVFYYSGGYTALEFSDGEYIDNNNSGWSWVVINEPFEDFYLNGSVGPANIIPTITISPATLSFGDVLVGTHSAVQSYTINGYNLTSPVTITAPSGYSIYGVTYGSWVKTLTLSPDSGNLNATIDIRFNPIDSTEYTGIITNESTGASIQAVAVTGTGIENDNPYIYIEPETLIIYHDFLSYCTPALPYRIYGNNLTDNIDIVGNFDGPGEVSFTGEDGSFASSLELTPLNGFIDTTVFVRLCPNEPWHTRLPIINSSSEVLEHLVVIAESTIENAPVSTIGNITAQPGTLVSVPLFVTNFFDINQAQYSIQFDPNVLTFQDLIYQMITNCWPETSVTQINENLSQLNILLQCATDVNITMPDNSKLFDLVFSYSSGTSSLTFGDCSFRSYWSGPLNDEPDSLYYHNGSVSQFQKAINLELNLEGLFNPSQGDMNQAYGRNFPDTIADEISIGIAQSTFPYAIQFEVDSVLLERTGHCQIEVPSDFNEEYYIVIKHRNSIETWSKYPVPFNTDTISYNFTDLISKAYNNNLKLKGVAYCIYAADINQDGVVDTGDMSIADTESSQFMTGYNPSDVNGDGNTDIGDMVIVDNNSSSFTKVQRPFSSFPVVITSDVSNITNSAAHGGGEVIEQGSSPVSTYGVCWSTEPNPTIADNFTSDGQGIGSFFSMITELWPNTTYYVRAFATNNTETVYGNQVSFVTSIYYDGAGVTDIDNNQYNSVILGTQEWMSENLRVTHYRNGEPISYVPDNTWSSLTSGAYSWYDNDEATYKNNYGALYNFYSVVDNRNLCPVGWHVPSEEDWNILRDFLGGADIAGGKLKSTRTTPELHPRWESPNVGASNISGFSGIPGGYRLQGGIFGEIGRSGYWWNATVDGSNNTYMRALDYNGDDLYVNDAHKRVGFSVRCLRGIDISTLTTTPIYNITGITAAGGGNITSDGGSPVTQRGVCWSISPNPTIADNHTYDGSGTGPFISYLTGLIPNTQYFVRAYATNSAGTSYGNQLTFASIANLPVIITNDVTDITQISALSGGNIISDAGNAVIFRGVCWSFSSEPTISDDHTTDGNGIGNFVSNLTGLTTNTQYYLRAYAVNSNGTAYGNEISFFTLPNVTTTPVSSITQTTASSGGEITFGGGASIMERGVCWSTSQNPTTADNHTSDGTGTGTYTSDLTGLTGNTVYYVRAYATNGSGTSYGSQFDFITAPLVPDVTTNPVINITMTGAKSGGNVTYSGGANVTARGVCWSTTASPTIADNHTANGSGIGAFVSNLTGLTPNTMYYARAYATNIAGTAYGNEITFTTLSYLILPTITTTEVTNVLSNTATSGGNVISDGGGAVTFRGVCWSTSPNPDISGSHTTDGSGTGAYTSYLTGLTPGTLYYVRAYAVNSVGIVYGDELSFTTGNCISPFTRSHIAGIVAPVDKTVTYGVAETYLSGTYKCWITQNLGADHQAASATDATEASAGWYWQFNKKQGYKHDGSYRTPNTTWLFPINENSNWESANDPCLLMLGNGWRIPTKTEWETADDNGGWDNYNESYASILKLHAAGSLYAEWGNLLSRGSEGCYWSNEQRDSNWGYNIYFSNNNSDVDWGGDHKEYGFPLRCLTDGTYTGSTIPTVSTTDITNINSNSAVSGGNVTNDGGETVTARGVCWSTSQNPTLADNHTTDGQGLGSFTSNITGLSHLTTYYVRAYAINCVGTAYGNEATFVSRDILPSITTSQISDITTNSAVSGGEVTYEGASAVTARGVCWSTSPNPTLADSYSIDGSGIGTFISTLPWLSPSTIYYARAYATNVSGTVYGNEESFKTELFSQGSGVIDFDNNTYNSVILGNQEWMSENLRVTHYLNGDNIPNVTDNTWNSLTSGAYCWYNNDEPTFKNTYGALYNWYTIVDDRNLCPVGWHIPNLEDWTTLTNFLGGADTAGGMMKSTSTAPDPHPRWDSPNVGATNESGFSGVPGGYRLQNGIFEEIGRSGYWWNDTIDGSDNVWMRALDYNGDDLYENSAVRQVGFSVRCLRGLDLPTLTTSSIYDISGISAVSGGSIIGDGGAPVTQRGVCWSTSPNPTITDSHTIDGSGTGPFISNITGLSLSTTYFVRAFATNVVGTAYGNQESFTTLPIEKTCNSFTLTHIAGNVAPVDKTITYSTVITNLSGSYKCWIAQNLGADHQAASATDDTEASAGWYWQFNSQQGYKHDGTTRIPNTTWNSFIDSSNWLIERDPCHLLLGSGWRIPTYTEWQNTFTSGGWASYNETYASVLKLHAAGHISSYGGTLSNRGSEGIYWSSSQHRWMFMGNRAFFGCSLEFDNSNININDFRDKSEGSSLRCLSDGIAGLTLPSVTTASLSNISQNSAECGGNVTYSGGDIVTGRGVCWSTNQNPTLSDNYTLDGSGAGPFVSNITGLNSSTIYYVRAYATNSVGTAYGNQESFVTPAGEFICGNSFTINHVAGSVAPVDKTVTYGTVETDLTGSNKCWITQNLGAYHQATTATDATEASAGWYWQFNRKQGYKHDGTTRTPNTTWITSISENTDWLPANDPCTLLLGSGWRLPTHTEWETADATGGWDNYNETFASVLKLHAAGGLTTSDGSLVHRGLNGNYWSSSQFNSDGGCRMNFDSGNSFMNYYFKAIGFSVRCLSD